MDKGNGDARLQPDPRTARKITLLWLVLRYGFIDHSVALFTEGSGTQKFHGRIALLVNEHSASASEMVAAFAAGNHLARIVGTSTPGRLVGGKASVWMVKASNLRPKFHYHTKRSQMGETINSRPQLKSVVRELPGHR